MIENEKKVTLTPIREYNYFTYFTFNRKPLFRLGEKTMNVTIYQGNDNQLNPSKVNIVIDVIRAFTVAHYAFLNEAKEIWLVRTVEEAFALKDKNPEYLLAGEVNGLFIDGFDLDNSPCSIDLKVKGRSLVQKTTNGVKATINSLNSNAVFVTGYSNAKTTANYVKELCNQSKLSSQINIIASHPIGDDDLACAEYIKAIIEGKNIPSPLLVEKRIRESHVAEKFYDEKKLEFNIEDISLCTKEVRSKFIMRVNQLQGLPKIERINI